MKIYNRLIFFFFFLSAHRKKKGRRRASCVGEKERALSVELQAPLWQPFCGFSQHCLTWNFRAESSTRVFLKKKDGLILVHGVLKFNLKNLRKKKEKRQLRQFLQNQLLFIKVEKVLTGPHYSHTLGCLPECVCAVSESALLSAVLMYSICRLLH